jgi:hypothetical protein
VHGLNLRLNRPEVLWHRTLIIGRPQPFEKRRDLASRALLTVKKRRQQPFGQSAQPHVAYTCQAAAAIAVVSPKERRGEDQKRVRTRRAESRMTSTKGDLHWLPSHETQPMIVSRREPGGDCLHAQPHALLRHAASKSSGPAGERAQFEQWASRAFRTPTPTIKYSCCTSEIVSEREATKSEHKASPHHFLCIT